ncbi:hypothetical protein MCOR25_009118 [Pyricularia grisea]|uniref:Extracellular membrane protein CFEM domain-containing protein n=1 Tax=Pyricularia grisea TaxID=148305 RepID=A0A6P8B6Z9_PYRGI|nr:hypothetical protein PgNI_05162 [Pyricularia grisea]KAI6353194.1 hypothetical protein MCOR25_009118 [Pyricularia grisea]TLD11096.1 hypothetical protein PgNI_05162 [Pyricularia grisea]
MYAPNLLSILAFTSAALVSANPVSGSGKPNAVGLERRWWPLKQQQATPVLAKQPTTPQPQCPNFFSVRGWFKQKEQGHCCTQHGDLDAISCCMLTATTPLPGATSELRCDNTYFSQARWYKLLEACNTGKQQRYICEANHIPDMPEVRKKYTSNGGKTTFGATGTLNNHPGVSRLGRYPNGDPAPADNQDMLGQSQGSNFAGPARKHNKADSGHPPTMNSHLRTLIGE